MTTTSRKSLRSPTHIKLLQLLIENRKNAGLTQAQLAESLGWPQSDVSKIETGDRRLDVVEFVNLCDGLGVDPCDVLKRLSASH